MPERKEEIVKVLKAKHIDTYHYHGSMFEYTWELNVKDGEGNKKVVKWDSLRRYDRLKGKTIRYDGSLFVVIDKEGKEKR